MPRPALTVPATSPLTLEGETRGVSAIPRASCEADTSGPEDVIRLAAMARTGVVVDSDTPRTRFDTVLSIRRACADAASEVACADDQGSAPAARLRAVLDAGNYLLLVDGAAGRGGPYGLTVRSFAPAPNATCGAATPLAPGATLPAQPLAAAGAPSSLCRNAAGGALYYRVAVPPASTVTVRANPTTRDVAPVLRALDQCASTACAATSTAEAPGMPSTLTLRNAASAERTWIVSLASSDGAEGPVDLSATTPLPLAPGTRCDAPIALTPTTPAMGVDARAASLSGASRCLPEVTAGQVFFSVRVPATSRATVRVTPTGSSPWAVALRGSTACDASCEGASAAAGTPTTLELRNGLTSPRDYLVSASAAAGAAATLDASVTFDALSPYSLTMIPAACDDVAMGSAVAPTTPTWEDDSASAPAVLPFSFRYFGVEVARWVVSSNGFVQLFGAADVLGATAYTNTPLPTPGAPDGIVAALWDDLSPSGATTSGVRAATLGAAPSRRLVVQWTDWAFAALDAARLTFQVKLFEGTGAVEIHHCAMAPATNDRVRGNSATVGLESLDGARGVTLSHDTAGGVTAGRAWRFTP